MKVAVFGTGIVGQVIAVRLAGLGHQVTIGTRDVANALSRTEKDHYGNPSFKEWHNQHKDLISLDTYSNAASTTEVIFNCTMGLGSLDALKQAANNSLKGKTIIDIANPLDFSKGIPPTLSPVNTDSLGEQIQRAFPEAKVVKTLNTMSCSLMVNPAAISEDHNVFISGNDASAKNFAKDILKSFGWKDGNIIDLGDITTARGTEQLLPIWVRLYGVLKTPTFNFKIVIGKPA